MVDLDEEALETLRVNFSRMDDGNGLSLDSFVRVMTDTFVIERAEDFQDRPVLLKQMVELFEEIDRNGNGKVEWQEITSYWVDSGLIAIRRFVEPLRFRFEEDRTFRDWDSRGPRINHIVYLPSINKIATFEKESMVVKLFDHKKIRLVTTVDVTRATKKYRMVERKRDEVNNCLVVKNLNVLVVISSDLSVTFWDATTFRFLHFAFSKSPLKALAHCNLTNKLFIVGSSPKIQVWAAEQGIRTDFITTKHKEPITDVIVHDGLIITSSLDKTIQLHDSFSHRFKGVLIGHNHGVTKLCFSEQQNMLLSIGMEPDALGWDLITAKQCIRLQSSNRSTKLIGIEILPGNVERAITGDENGNFKVWDFSRNHSGLGVCLQTFQRLPKTLLQGSIARNKKHISKKWSMDDFYPTSFCITEGDNDVVAASSKLVRFSFRGHKEMDNIPNGALFNKTCACFVTITGKDIQLWNGSSGEIEEDMYNVSGSDMTKLILDDRQRKFIVGSADGKVRVHSFPSGVKMKEIEKPHADNVTGLAYLGREKILISVGRDCALKIHDEWPEDCVAPFLRGVRRAHKEEISCVAYSEAFSLVATGSSDTTVRLWNFEFLKQEFVITFHNTDVTAVSFVGDLPLIASSDSSGVFLLSKVSPTSERGDTVLRWVGQPSAPITAFQVLFDEKWICAMSNDSGEVSVISLDEVIKNEQILPRPQEAFPRERKGYNARRRLTRNDDSNDAVAIRTIERKQRYIESSFSSNQEEDQSSQAPILAFFKAHDGPINSLQMNDAPLSVVTASMDRFVKIHSIPEGKCLGVLNMSDEAKDRLAKGVSLPDEWKWTFDIEPARKFQEGNLEKLSQSVVLKLSENAKISTGCISKREVKCFKRPDTLSSLDSNESVNPLNRVSHSDVLRSQVLQQMDSGDPASLSKLMQTTSLDLSSVSSYANLHQEQSRNAPTNRLRKSLSAEPSEFLRYHLHFGHARRLRERKTQKLKSLGKFKRKFAPGLSLQNSEQEDLRPNTAPTLGLLTSSSLMPSQILVESVENLISCAVVDPLPPNVSNRPSTAFTSSDFDEFDLSLSKNAFIEDWRRRSVGVLNKVNAIIQQPDVDAESAVITNVDNVQIEKHQGSTRRKSLIMRQKEFAAKNCKFSKKSLTQKASHRRDTAFGIRFGPYHESEVRYLYEMFCKMDPDQSGAIDILEFYMNPEWRDSPILASLGSIFESMDEDENACIELNEFLSCFLPLADRSEINAMMRYLGSLKKEHIDKVVEKESSKKNELSTKSLEEISEIFRQVDSNGDGVLEFNELKVVAAKTGFVTEEELEAMMNEFASKRENGSSLLTKEDFIEMTRDYFACENQQLLKQVVNFNARNTASRHSFTSTQD